MKPMRTTILAPLLALALAGCGDETTAPPVGQPEPPTLPPAETMRFDFSFFGSERDLGAALQSQSEEAGTKFNWLNAVVRVAYINLAVAQAFTPPAAAFHAALSTQPIIEEDGTFLWTYRWISPEAREVVIRLRGRIDGVHVDWSLRVSDDQQEPPLDDFLWFYGRSTLIGRSGWWIFLDPRRGEGTEVFRIDWHYENPADRNLRFENIDEGHEEFGDRLAYRVDAPIVSVTFYDASENRTADITWDRGTGTGSLKVPDYNDGERACWDENQEDIECPEESR